MKKVKLLGVLLLSSLLFTACGDKKEEVKTESSVSSEVVTKDTTKKEEPKKEKFYEVGETAEVEGISYTLNSVELTDERNQFDETKPEHVITVRYEVTNNTDKDVPVGTDVSAYGPDGKKLEGYANESTIGSVAVGKSIDVTKHFGLNELGEVELQFVPFASRADTANFKVDVK